jgi:hypothetical protein
VAPEAVVGLLAVGGPFSLEVSGPADPNVVLFLAHGFGVRRDARGLFPAIRAAVDPDVLVVCPDLADPSARGTRAVRLSHQAARIEAARRFVEAHYVGSSFYSYHPLQSVYITHSQGALALALARPHGATVVLLAPPLGPVFHRFIRVPGWSRLGSSLTLSGTSQLVRSDGSVTEVPQGFWDDLLHADATQLYRRLVRENRVFVVQAGDDRVVGPEPPPARATSRTLAGADHDFSGRSRAGLVALLEKLGLPVRSR